jgi:hypothetical protein
MQSTQQALLALENIRNAIPATDMKSQRKIDIAESIVSYAGNITSELVSYSKYSRKLPRIVRKHKYSRKEAKKMLLNIYLQQYFNAVHLATKISQPIPKTKFPSGGIK